MSSKLVKVVTAAIVIAALSTCHFLQKTINRERSEMGLTRLAVLDNAPPNYYTDLNGDDAILYINRSSTPKKLAYAGDIFTMTEFSLPNKGNNNGAFPFIWDGKELVVYPTLDNYLDGFAVAEINAVTPLAYVGQTVSVDANTYQANWLNAEVVDSRHVTIYQYYPGGHITVWSLTKQGGILRGDVDDDGTVGMDDLTALINYLLTDNDNGINLENANCDGSDGVGMDDLAALINYLLTNTWHD